MVFEVGDMNEMVSGAIYRQLLHLKGVAGRWEMEKNKKNKLPILLSN